MRRFSLLLVVVSLLAVVPATARAQGAPADNEFEVTTLAKGGDKTGEPIAMAVLPDRRVLHTSRDGRVWLTTPNATTSLAGTIPVYSHDEDGLQGIAIDADFATNRWVYVYYAPPLTTPAGDAPDNGVGPAAFEAYKGHNQLSRIKLTEAGTLDLASEQQILQVPADRGICCHAGGEIDFDAQGNLYLSTGDDSNPFQQDGYTPIDERDTRNPAFDAQRSSANTNDLRGKLLRIKVAADGSYTVPEGNLFAPGTDKTRPEIYAMGFRNPFRFSVDRTTGWIYLGDYGPDAGGANPTRGPGGQVEFNLIKSAGNYGWPYCHGRNDAYNDYDFATGVSGAKFDCAAPKNTSPRNTGLVDLPPARPAWIAYDACNVPQFGCGSESPMGGPTYHFDASNPSKTKFPAYFDGKNFAYEFGRGWLRTLTGTDETAMPAIESFLDSFDFKQLINIEFGPEGSLYVLDYGTGYFSGDANSAVYRVDYVQGTRTPIAELKASKTSGPAPLTVEFDATGSNDPDGTEVTYAWDFNGDGTTDSTALKASHTYATAGRYTATLAVTDGAGLLGRASVNITAGNTAPAVEITFPAQGSAYEYGDVIPYRITVTDSEDGMIDCDRVRFDTALGHNEHTHGDQNFTGCSGTFRIAPPWEDKTQHTFYVLNATYTDTTSGLELTGTDQVVLEHRTQQAEFLDAQNGTQQVNHPGAAGGARVGYIDPGDWLRFDDINLTGIDTVTARVSSYGDSSFELRAGSPTGQVLARSNVPNQGSPDNYVTLPPVPIADPGETFDLYVVFTGASMDLDEFTFNGPGVTGNGTPQLTASATPLTGTAPLKVDFTADAVDPEGKALTYAWDFGATTANASHTYTERGVYTPTLTVTDADGRKAVRSFRIDVQPDCSGTSGASDEFNGSALDFCRWTTIVRETPSGYRVREGALEIDAVPGDMYGGDTSARNVILQDAPTGGWEAITKVKLPQGEEYEQAGLIAHNSDATFSKLVLMDIPGLGWRVEFGQNLDGQPIFDESLDRSGPLPANINSDGIWLRLQSTGQFLLGAWSADGQNWTPFGRSRTQATQRIGLAAYNGNGQAAAFDFFRLEPRDVQEPCRTGATPDAGYRMLFDGTATSLSAWRMAGPGGFALQQDCSILSYGGLGLLWHPDSFGAYSLKLDWKMAGDDNAGVFVGFKDPGNDPYNAVNGGHEIQIDATDDPSHTTGAVYNFQAPVAAARDAALKPPGEWNAYEIVVIGDRIQVFLNGTKINDYVDSDPNRMNAPTLLGLQNHGTGDDVFFRNVQIKELPAPTSPAPSLALTAPADGAIVGETVTVSGTTDGSSVVVRAGTVAREVTPSGGAFSVEVPLALGSNAINVFAFNADGVGVGASRTVFSRSFGTLVGSLSDPRDDDNGPGTYRYPTNGVYTPGIFDLENVEVYADGDNVRFVTRIRGAITNQFGGDQISHQRINVYLGAGDGSPVAAMPGTNMDVESPWSRAVVIDGRFGLAGVYAPDGSKVTGGTLSSLAETREIVLTVPRSSLGSVDPASARYGVAMFGNAEGGEGVGNVRPVYDLAYWQNPGPDFWWITEYRFGGGAGVWTDAPNHDSDTRDPNALDVIVRPGQTQAAVLNWQAGSPTKVPMQGLTLPPDTTPPTVSATFLPDDGDAYTQPVVVTLTGSDDRPGVKVEYLVDGGPWTLYSQAFAVVSDGVHTVDYRATDAAGNHSAVGSKTFTIDKPSEVSAPITGTVPATLSITLGAPPSFGTFAVGVGQDYTASTTATVTSSAANATLTVVDPTGSGRLRNGDYTLLQALQVRAGTGAFGPLGGTLAAFDGPVTGAPVPVEFKQSIGAGEALRRGLYSTTLTFTLSTTTP